MVKVVTKESLVEQRRQQRIADLEKMEAGRQRDQFLESLHSGIIPNAQFAEDFDIRKEVNVTGGENGVVAEFIGNSNFNVAFYKRQQYEVDAGRDEEPLIYQNIYSVRTDASLPKIVPIYVLGPTGVVFQRINEGGEVEFASVGEYDKSLTIVHHGTGIEYSEDLFMYNELFRLANIERQFGVAYNALLNHTHMAPILTATNLTGNNATDGTALTTFKATASMPEKYLRTVESAITASATDKTNPRKGPYALLVSSADVFTAERALTRVPQEGFDSQSSAIGRVNTILEYDGWSGTRGKKSTTYDGVPAGTAYLVSLAHRTEDFMSMFKHGLRRQMDQGSLLKFIMARTVWDVRFGVFADPKRSVQKITWPVAGSGAS